MTTGDNQLRGWTEKIQSTSLSQTCTNKGHGHCLVVCCLSDSLQFSESQPNHYIWEVCSAYQWDAPKTAMPTASIGQKKGLFFCTTPNCTSHNQCFKSWTNWGTKFSLIYIHLIFFFANDYDFFNHLNTFLQGKCFHNQQEAENAKSSSNPKTQTLMLQE